MERPWDGEAWVFYFSAGSFTPAFAARSFKGS
jgi:hypothetical protein